MPLASLHRLVRQFIGVLPIFGGGSDVDGDILSNPKTCTTQTTIQEMVSPHNLYVEGSPSVRHSTPAKTNPDYL